MSTQNSIQNFFRVYMPNVTDDDMNLPFYWDDISVTPLPRKVTVKSVSSGNVWRMEMRRNDESESVFLREGWKKIVKDENLKEPMFLVFEFDGSREFHFCVYEHGSTCKRMRSPIEKEVIQVESEEEGLDESPKRNERGGSYMKTNSEVEYLDNSMNPSFPIDTTRKRTRIPSALIKDYNLKFHKGVIIVRDKLGKLKRKISVWNNRSVILNGLTSIIQRNQVKPGDKVVCELKMVHGFVIVQGEYEKTRARFSGAGSRNQGPRYQKLLGLIVV